MPVELRKPQLFDVSEDYGDDNDNHRNHFTYRAFDFDQVCDAFEKSTRAEYADDEDIVYVSTDGDGDSLNIWHNRMYICDSCWGTGFMCKHSNTHQAYTERDIDYTECDECVECRDCEDGSNSIPLHNTITLEHVHNDESDTYGTIIDLVSNPIIDRMCH